MSRCTALPCTTVWQSAITARPRESAAAIERNPAMCVHFDSQNDFTNNCHAAEDEIVALIHWKTKPFPSAACIAMALPPLPTTTILNSLYFFASVFVQFTNAIIMHGEQKIVYYLSAELESRKSSIHDHSDRIQAETMNGTVTPDENEHW